MGILLLVRGWRVQRAQIKRSRSSSGATPQYMINEAENCGFDIYQDRAD